MTRKNRRSLICVETAETDMLLLPPLGGSLGMTRVWNLVGSRTRWGEDSHLNPRYENVRTEENWGPYFGMGSEKQSHATHEPMQRKPANKQIEIQGRKFKVCLCPYLFSHDMSLVVKLTQSTQLSYSLPFCRRLLKKFSVE